MALKRYYIDMDFNLGSICLGCVELIEDYTGNNIADALIMLPLEYNIEILSKNICSFTTDHGYNVLKAVENLNITLYLRQVLFHVVLKLILNMRHLFCFNRDILFA